MKFKPQLDQTFRPMVLAYRSYVADVEKHPHKELKLCVERNDGYNYIFAYPIYDAAEKTEENCRMAERIAKTLLWIVGGFKIYVAGDRAVFEYLKEAYTPRGLRAFDADFMETVYESPFSVVFCDEKDFPAEKTCSLQVGGNLDGCRIGFDAGGSDRKVSAVVNGEVVYSEEVVWHPKVTEDPRYHYNEILTAMRTAASKMPTVDAIGVSSAGVYVNNRIMVASLFLKVPKEAFRKTVRTMYIDVAKELSDEYGKEIPLEVANDGDVTALAGAIDLNDTNVLGIAMGTSEAVGYINRNGGLNGWLSELAFVPVDYDKRAMTDEWSGDYGCGSKYFSQDAVIKLAESGGVRFDEKSTPAEKLNVVQQMMKNGDALAKTIYEDIGIYLGYTLPYYAMFYDIRHVLLLGRVTSGTGGNIIMETANRVLAEEFPQLGLRVEMPDEKNRRVGQSIAAASLPRTREKENV